MTPAEIAARLTPAQVKLCPVCHRPPTWCPSMIRDAESLDCNWDDGCPTEGSFDFCTGYLPVPEAITAWNKAVDEWEARAEADVREAALQYLSDTGQLMDRIANLKDRESYLVDLLDRITDYQAVIDCLSMPELNEVSCTLAAYEKGKNT